MDIIILGERRQDQRERSQSKDHKRGSHSCTQIEILIGKRARVHRDRRAGKLILLARISQVAES